MKVTIQVKPNARKEAVETLPSGELKVSVNAPPQEGRANEAVIRLLAEHYGVPKSKVTIKLGASGRRKVVEIAE